jgi:hypothetical protein
MPIPTAPKDVTKQISFFEQLTYLTTPTDPQHINAGVIMNVDVNENIDDEEVRIQGDRHLYSDIKMGKEATVSLEYALINTTLARYGSEDPLGSGTIEHGIEIVQARKLNATEQVRVGRAALTDSMAISLERIPRITQNFYVPDLTPYMSIADYKTYLGIVGTGSPKWADPITEDPWTHLTGSNGSATTLEIDGDPVDVARATINVNNNIIKQKPLGHENTLYACAGNQVITISVEPFLYDNTFRDLVADFEEVQVVAMLNADADVAITLDGVKFNTHGDTANAGANDFNTNPLQGKVKRINIDEYIPGP